MSLPNVILFDGNCRPHLLPLTYTRPVADLRVGITTIREKWEHHLNTRASTLTEGYLSTKYPAEITDDNLLINGGLLPDDKLVETISSLQPNHELYKDDILLAARYNGQAVEDFRHHKILGQTEKMQLEEECLVVQHLWDIFRMNGEALKRDFDALTAGRASAPVSSTNTVLGDDIFIEEGAKVECATINTNSGPVYIGKDAEVMEGSLIRGPFALCGHSAVKMGARIYGPTTVGPYSKVGGELNNVVVMGYSNKAHDGFLGNSVIGEWCNIGADSNNSNLKNNYVPVKLWSYVSESMQPTGLQFCGLIMGDHSKCGINSMFNTGTVVGVSANIYGADFPPNFIPSFSWGSAKGFSTYKIDKAFETAERVMQRRDITLTDEDKRILTEVFSQSEKYRKF